MGSNADKQVEPPGARSLARFREAMEQFFASGEPNVPCEVCGQLIEFMQTSETT